MFLINGPAINGSNDYILILNDSVDVSESRSKDISINKNEYVNITESKTLSSAYQLTLFDYVDISESEVNGATRALEINETVNISESRGKNIGKSILESLGITDSRDRGVATSISETILASENIARGKYWDDENSINGNLGIINGEAINGPQNYAKLQSIDESIDISESQSRLVSKNISEHVSVSELLNKSPLINIFEGVDISENVTREEVGVSKLIIENLKVSESTSKIIYKNINEDIKITENYDGHKNEAFTENVSENVSISESVTTTKLTTIFKTINETVEISESTTNVKSDDRPVELINYYQSLLILQYRNKENALATVANFIRPVLMDFLPIDTQNAFNINTAVGAQLDILGKYIGISRRVLTFTGGATLSDSDYRILLKLKIVLNNLGSSLYDIQKFIFDNMSGMLHLFDNRLMVLSYYLDSDVIGNTLAEAIIKQGLLPKPMGVGISSVTYLSSFDDLFGFQTYTRQDLPVNGFNDYTNFHTNWHFVGYEDALNTEF